MSIDYLENNTSMRRLQFRPGRWLVWMIVVVLSGPLVATDGWSQGLRNNFADRQILTAPGGSVRGNNSAATLEPGEPSHGGKPGGHSLWISWVAPDNGVVKFETEGSGFDTLLAAYTLPTASDTALNRLVLVAAADDSQGFDHESQVEFGVLAGHRYEIAVDGYFGETGPVELEWSFLPTALPPPIILAAPTNRTVNFGDTVTLTVALTNETNGRYQWYHNADLLNVDSPTLVIPGVQAADVGYYKLRVIVGGADYFSAPAEVQINSEGASGTRAQDKLMDALNSPLSPDGTNEPGGAGLIGILSLGMGVLRGYNGSQIFSTVFALVDPDEPAHCGVTSSASYWFAYQSPADGTVTLDTLGSSFDTVLAVYTYDPPLTSYRDMMPITCNNDALAPAGASRVEFAGAKGRHYAVVVAGVGRARGLATLHYHLDVTRLPLAPTLMVPPRTITTVAGTDVTLQPQIVGSEPMSFVWSKDGKVIAGATAAALRISAVNAANSGAYTVTVFNLFGGPLEVTLLVRVLVAPVIQIQSTANGPMLSVQTMAGPKYSIERRDSLAGSWRLARPPFVGDGSVVFFTDAPHPGNSYWRARVE